MLRAIRDYGFLDSERLLKILHHRGFTGTNKWMRLLANELYDRGVIHIERRALKNKLNVYSVTRDGHKKLDKYGCGLYCAANPKRDAAKIDHFLTLADISNKFQNEIQTVYWLTDFQIKSENQAGPERAFAKDYDAVFETDVGGYDLTVAIEYERVRKSKERYREISKCYAHDKHVQMVLFVVEHASWIEEIARVIDPSADSVYFATKDDLLGFPLRRYYMSHLVNGSFEDTYLYEHMRTAARKAKSTYNPTYAYFSE